MDDKTIEKIYEEKYPQKDYERKQFPFTRTEVARIITWENDVLKGTIANNLLNKFMVETCLQRVGIANGPKIGIRYDSTNGLFYVYIPK